MCEPIIYKKHMKSEVPATGALGADIDMIMFKFVCPCAVTHGTLLCIY